MLSIKPSRLVVYYEYVGSGSSHKTSSTWQDNFVDNSTHGKISISARKKIQNSIDWLIFLSPYKKVYNKQTKQHFKFKINFITLTLPAKQFHDDGYIKKKMLNTFLQILRDKYKVKFYIWRAEAQKNGNIHFHITTNVFIEWWMVRKYWNRILDKHGYIKHYSRNQKEYFAQGFKMSENPNDKRSFKQQYKSYIWNSFINWQSPNSTDIHSVKNIHNLSRYLSKYMTKESSERAIEGRLWFMSSELGKLGSASGEVYSSLADELSLIKNHFSKRYRKYDHAKVLYVSYDEWKNLPVPTLRNIFHTYFNETMFKINFKI